ncbi:MAG: LytR/AlgR family response regulator transcription factor [Ruminococcus sp.]
MGWNKIIIYDDVQSFAEELKNMLISAGCSAEIVTVDNSEDAVRAMDGCDLLILDIVLENGRDGIEFFRKMKKREDLCFQTILISGYLHNVERAYEVEADSYLIKPVTEERLELCLQRLLRKTKRDTALVTVKNGVVSLSMEKVLYIENSSRHAKYYVENGTETESISPFSSLEDTIPEYFCRCHKSFYVNMYHAASLQRYAFILDNGKEVPVSQSRYSETKNKYTRFIGKVL